MKTLRFIQREILVPFARAVKDCARYVFEWAGCLLAWVLLPVWMPVLLILDKIERED